MISNHTLTNSKTILIECQFLIEHFWVKKYSYPFYVLHPIMGIHVTEPLKDLEFLKYQNLPGPFSTAKEVDLYMNYNESDSVRNHRIYIEVRYARKKNSQTYGSNVQIETKLHKCRK